MAGRHTARRGRDERLRSVRTRIEGARTVERKAAGKHAPKRAENTGELSPMRRFLRFSGSSLLCTGVDQLLAAALFSLLREPMAGAGFLRILVCSVAARCVSLSLNYALNHRLVFVADAIQDGDAPQRKSTRHQSLPRFAALAAFVLALSTIIVFAAHTLLGVREWQAKLVADLGLFFVNYFGQRNWVFQDEATVRPRLQTR